MARFDRAKQFDKKEYGKTTKFSERDRPRSRDSSSGRSSSRDSGRGQSKDSGLQLYHAVCDKCGKDCDLPFKPTGNKPVFCRNCFKANGPEESRSFDRGRSDNRSESRDRFEPRTSTQNVTSEDIEKINIKLDKIMKALKI